VSPVTNRVPSEPGLSGQGIHHGSESSQQLQKIDDLADLE